MNKKHKHPIFSKTLNTGEKLETLFDTESETLKLLIASGSQVKYGHEYKDKYEKIYTPNSRLLQLVKDKVILLPSEPKPFTDQQTLINQIQSFIHKYVDLDESEEILASYYILLTWVHDFFNEIPYLRKVGDYGTGKTRFLTVLGSICYKSIFASGASTMSPIFHLLDSVEGTLILDEADMRFSDAKSDMAKILNNGFMKGFPVLRSMPDKTGSYTPRSYKVFSPKIIATRDYFQDSALESRFITFRSNVKNLRKDIPITLPELFIKEADNLRNQLLEFRLSFKTISNLDKFGYIANESRLNQILLPIQTLMTIDIMALEQLKEYSLQLEADIKYERDNQDSSRVLNCINILKENGSSPITIGDITSLFIITYGENYTYNITPKRIGNIVRKSLNIQTFKSNGVYIIKH